MSATKIDRIKELMDDVMFETAQDQKDLVKVNEELKHIDDDFTDEIAETLDHLPPNQRKPTQKTTHTKQEKNSYRAGQLAAKKKLEETIAKNLQQLDSLNAQLRKLNIDVDQQQQIIDNLRYVNEQTTKKYQEKKIAAREQKAINTELKIDKAVADAKYQQLCVDHERSDQIFLKMHEHSIKMVAETSAIVARNTALGFAEGLGNAFQKLHIESHNAYPTTSKKIEGPPAQPRHGLGSGI